MALNMKIEINIADWYKELTADMVEVLNKAVSKGMPASMAEKIVEDVMNSTLKEAIECKL